MNLGVQYYRAPFPESRFWEDDMRRMRDAGLNTVPGLLQEPRTARSDLRRRVFTRSGIGRRNRIEFALSRLAFHRYGKRDSVGLSL